MPAATEISMPVESRIYLSDAPDDVIQLSMLTSAISLLGFISTTILEWRREKREVKLGGLEEKRQEIEIEKIRFELDKMKTTGEESEYLNAKLILPKRKIEIIADENKFGRSDFERDLSIVEICYISKNHFSIIKQDGTFYIQDDHSVNGTRLNGREIRSRGRIELKNEDEITLAGIINFNITFKISRA